MPEHVPPQPLPAALVLPCPEPIERRGSHADDAVEALKILYDQYGKCAGEKVDLINWIMERRP
ncbi:hypothetical protein [Nitrincola iocasae]